MGNIPDFILYASGFVVAVFLYLASIYNTENKTLSIRFFCGALVFAVFTIIGYGINDFRKSQANINPPEQGKKDNTYRNYSISHVKSPQTTPTKKVEKRLVKPIQPTLTSHPIHQQLPPINAPDSIFSIDQRGGFTGKMYIDTTPPPNIEIKTVSLNIKNKDGAYISSYRFSVKSIKKIRNLYLVAHSPFIIDMDVYTVNVNGNIGYMSESNIGNKVSSYKITEVISGEYGLEITSSKPDNIKVEPKYDQ